MNPPHPSIRLRELALAFLRLGVTAFGGPAAHIAMMEREFVTRGKWLSRDEFLDLVSAASLIPGPSSSEVALFIGLRRNGAIGLLIAGFGFILPAACMTAVLAWIYTSYGQLPAARGALHGIKPVLIAIVAQALWNLGRSAIKNPQLALLCLAAWVANLLGLGPLAVLLGAGLLSAAATHAHRSSGQGGLGALIALVGTSQAMAATVKSSAAALGRLGLAFLKVGAFQFGSGYALLAFLRSDLVLQEHWVSESQLLDAIAVGQFTPGPVFTTATFIGYLTQGPWGAVVATVAVFLPAFLLVGLIGPFLPRLRRSKTAGAFLDGVNAATVALLAVVSGALAHSALVDLPTGLIAVASAVALTATPLNSAWLVLAGGLLGTLIG